MAQQENSRNFINKPLKSSQILVRFQDILGIYIPRQTNSNLECFLYDNYVN